MQKIYILLVFVAFANAAFAQSELTIGSSATMHLTGGASLTLHNTKLTNKGSMAAPNGTFRMTGNATNANAAIGGTGTTALQHLTINKTANAVQLNQNISVSGNLTLTSGGVELAAGDIDFGTTGSLQSETEANRVYGTGGKLSATATLNAPANVNPANLGAALTATTNFGSTLIERKHAPASATGGNGIQRNYGIHPTTNTGLNATLRFHYHDAELNGSDENSMVLWRSVNGSTNWISQTIMSRNPTANWVEVSGINAFSSWTSANPGALPVKLLAFTGYKDKNGHQLNWTTATEQNSSYFEVQVAEGGGGGTPMAFKTIGSVRAAGNSNTPKYYDFTNDIRNISPPREGAGEAYYYRLKMIDFDGSFEYSNVISITEKGERDLVKCYPNPTENILNIDATDRTQTVTVTDEIGRTVQTHTTTPNTIDLSALAAGVYHVRVGYQHFKVVKL